MPITARMFSPRAMTLIGLVAALGLCPAAWAGLDVGDAAPAFKAQAVQDGKIFEFSLSTQLAKGPVILYFFPAAFSEDCSIEAREFSEAIPEFAALGATVVGISGDDIETLAKFSQKVCNGRFAVISDPGASIMKSYDAVMRTRPEFANRISYVLTPEATVAHSYMSLNPSRHVQRMLDGLRKWRQDKGR